MTALHYEIRVAGRLPPEVLLDFECLNSLHEVETVLHGPLPDQAALHKLLARLEIFRTHVLEVRRLRAGEPTGRRQACGYEPLTRREDAGRRWPATDLTA